MPTIYISTIMEVFFGVPPSPLVKRFRGAGFPLYPSLPSGMPLQSLTQGRFLNVILAQANKMDYI